MLNKEISAKQKEIDSKNKEISKAQKTLQDINNSLKFANNFTKNQLLELDNFKITRVKMEKDTPFIDREENQEEE